MMRPAFLAALALSAAVTSAAVDARAQRVPDGAALVRLLGAHAVDAFAPPGSHGIGALVRLPSGVRPADLGLREVAPGIGRVWGPPERLLEFADAHPDLPLEVAPPLHLLLNTAVLTVNALAANTQGLDGSGVLVGIADTGLDVTHPDFLDAKGHTRVAWLLDLSSPPLGVHFDLEQMFGTTDGSGRVVLGAVWSAADIDAAIAAGSSAQRPLDEVGHGTLVASCAAGKDPRPVTRNHPNYSGVAPAATLLIARIANAGTAAIGNDDLLRGVAFLFDRADAMQQPVVVNLSIGTDFGPHDGTTAWEETLASNVGPGHPGRAIVAAAGNSGSIADTAVHQNVHVSAGTEMRVPIVTGGTNNGGVQVWVAMHGATNLKVGLDGPDGTWITPIGPAQSAGKHTSDYDAAIYNGSEKAGSPVPEHSHGAVVVWQGKWGGGTYSVTLSGSGTADLYLEPTDDAAVPGDVGFASAVREGTINLPATHSAIIGVGCTINKKAWRSLDDAGIGLAVPLLDPAGGAPDPSGLVRDAVEGEPCWFSSAGPTLTGVAKPEIMAPGAAIVGAMSQQAVPPADTSIFTNTCPTASQGEASPDLSCQEVDPLHGVSFGTSFSAPVVAGTVAAMFQHDPTLTQDTIVAALQGGAHPLRAAWRFDDQAGAGEVDVLGAIAAVDRLRDPQLALPDPGHSWLIMGASEYLADGSTPLQAILELRAAPVGGAAWPADGFGEQRLAPYALVDGRPAPGAVPSLLRRGPGVWVITVSLPAGLGGSGLTVGVKFDGVDIVQPKTIAIATDVWSAAYAPSVKGGCAVSATVGDRGRDGAGMRPLSSTLFLLLGSALVLRGRRSHGREARSRHAGRLADTVEGELEQDGSDHLVDGDGRNGQGPKRGSDGRKFTGD